MQLLPSNVVAEPHGEFPHAIDTQITKSPGEYKPIDKSEQYERLRAYHAQVDKINELSYVSFINK